MEGESVDPVVALQSVVVVVAGQLTDTPRRVIMCGNYPVWIRHTRAFMLLLQWRLDKVGIAIKSALGGKNGERMANEVKCQLGRGREEKRSMDWN